MKKVTRDAFVEAVDHIDEDLLAAHDARQTPVKSPRRFPWRQTLLAAACIALLAALTVTAVLIAGRTDGTGEWKQAFGTRPLLPADTRETVMLPEGGDRPSRPLLPAVPRETVSLPEGGERPSRPDSLSDCALVQAELPVGPKQPDDYASNEEHNAYRAWWQNHMSELNQLDLHTPQTFFTDCAAAFLADAEPGENRVIAPLNTYMAMAMLSETAAGDTQRELLKLLGERDIEALRKNANGLFRGTCVDDGLTTCLLNASLWLNRNFTYKKETLNVLRDDYYASVYAGEMGSSDFGDDFRAWLNYATGGLLQDSLNGAAFDPSDIAVLCSTLQFNAKWENNVILNEQPGVFHGTLYDRECTMLTADAVDVFIEGASFTSVDKPLNDGWCVRFVLPKDGYTVDDLLRDRDTAAYVMGGQAGGSITSRYVILHEAIPAFDITDSTDLIPGLQSLGVGKCFSGEADFTPLTEDTGLFISAVRSDVRLILDKEGVTGAAAIRIHYSGAGMPEDEVWFTCDRPFLCVVLNRRYNVPLFAAVVNDP